MKNDLHGKKINDLKRISSDEKDIFQFDLSIPSLSGECRYPSPFPLSEKMDDAVADFIRDDERVLSFINTSVISEVEKAGLPIPTFEKAGPRKKLFFEPGETNSAIVTCGGICPGLNAVIRSIVNMNYYRYNNRRIYGIRYGFEGFIREYGHEVMMLSAEQVADMQMQGGTILGTSRGPQNIEDIVSRLVELKVQVLYTIGGDGTQKGALKIVQEIQKRNLKIAVIGVPKTIDNDVNCIDKSFGTETAFSEACSAIEAAHTEAKSANNGIGIVKVMGRDSGFIAANATLATNLVNYCLIPELDFELHGKKGLLSILEERIRRRKHALIVVAEGAGQHYLHQEIPVEKDVSGNLKLGDIGIFLKNTIQEHMEKQKVPVCIKYIDPSYIIRSVGPTPNDAIFCSQLGQMAVHAGMSGKTGMVVGYINGQFTHIPIDVTVAKRKRINLESQLWLSVLESTGQPIKFKND